MESRPVNSVLIYVNDSKKGASEVAAEAQRQLESRGARTAVIHDLSGNAEVLWGGGKSDCGAMLSIGGDGTILRCALFGAVHCLPVLGVNLGNLGFLSEVEPHGLPDAIDALLRGDYRIEERTMLNGSCAGRDILALNELLIYKGPDLKMVDVRVCVNGVEAGEFHSDGLIVCTATGSTAYSLSAGGPVLAPDASAFVITPVCPHALTARPMIVSETSDIQVYLDSDIPASLSADGSVMMPDLTAGMGVDIRAAEIKALFIHLRNYNFFRLVRKKLY